MGYESKRRRTIRRKYLLLDQAALDPRAAARRPGRSPDHPPGCPRSNEGPRRMPRAGVGREARSQLLQISGRGLARIMSPTAEPGRGRRAVGASPTARLQGRERPDPCRGRAVHSGRLRPGLWWTDHHHRRSWRSYLPRGHRRLLNKARKKASTPAARPPGCPGSRRRPPTGSEPGSGRSQMAPIYTIRPRRDRRLAQDGSPSSGRQKRTTSLTLHGNSSLRFAHHRSLTSHRGPRGRPGGPMCRAARMGTRVGLRHGCPQRLPTEARNTIHHSMGGTPSGQGPGPLTGVRDWCQSGATILTARPE